LALAPFFDRVYGAVGGHLSVSRESLISVLDKVSIGISCAPSLSWNDQCIAELTTNLLARLYPRIAIAADSSLAPVLRKLALQINPSIEFSEDALGCNTICVGDVLARGGIYPSASGWVARLDHEGPRASGVNNPFSAAASAAFACAELFRRVFLQCGPERDISLSLLDFSKDRGLEMKLAERHVGNVAFVGVGAVGNAAIWTLARDVTLNGTLLLVDHETLSLSNLQRYVLGTCADVSKHKVKLAKSTLRHSKLQVQCFPKKLETFANKHATSEFPTICISVDNIPSRRAAQALLPRLAINGWTGDRALGVSWHVFSRNASCLACLYHPRGQGLSAVEQAARALGLSADRAAILWLTRLPLADEDIKFAAKALEVPESRLSPWRGKPLGELYTDVVCGAVPLDVGGLGKVETVPLAHQSALAGILMAAELVKRTDAELAELSQPESLVTWDDVTSAPPSLWRKPRAREEGCICGDEVYQSVYKQKWG